MKKKWGHSQPPEWANRFLEWYCHEDLIEEIRGDLYESYDLKYHKQGQHKAKWNFVWNVIRFFKWSNFKKKDINISNNIMFRNYLKTSVRSIFRNRVFSFINIFGLALAMTACFFILKYVTFEQSYDDFHTNGDHIYRISADRYYENVLYQQWAAAPAAIGPALKYNFPEVTEYVKMRKENSTLTYNDITFREDRAFYASQAFFRAFSYQLILGVDSLVLQAPFTMTISESTAAKYFKNEDPIGKTLKLNGKTDLLVAGVFKDVPENSHMKFDVLYSFETLISLSGETARNAWDWYGFYTYVLLDENSKADQLESKIPDLVDREYGEELEEGNNRLDLHLQPLKDIHLKSNFMHEFEVNGDKNTVLSLTIIAIFILIIAWVNYINLATAKALDRAKEIGVRKVLGSGKKLLIKQFLFEAFIINILAALLTVLLIGLFTPEFNSITGRHLSFNEFVQIDFGVFLVVMSILGTISAGFYPAFVLAQFQPLTTLKGKFSRSMKGNIIRKFLVIFQFVASIALMIGVFIIYKQVNFMRSQDLGVDIERTLVVKGPSVLYDQAYYDQQNAFKTELLRNPSISSMTVSSQIPGNPSNNNAGGVKRVGENESQGKGYAIVDLDYAFVEAYGLELVAGKNFSRDLGEAVWNSAIFNESAVAQMGFNTTEEAIGKKIEFWGSEYKIVGVIKDYHQESLKSSFEPTIYKFFPLGTYYSVKVDDQGLAQTIEIIKKSYDTFFEGNNGFDYFFLDNHYDQQYKAELQFSKAINASAVLAIIIACLGLFGLSTFTIAQRKKEIGIRKVLGASLRNILSLLARSFCAPLVIAFLISVPIAWYVMNDWLQNFAYTLDLKWWFFAIPGIITIAIALLTMSYQTIRTSISNPVEALKYE